MRRCDENLNKAIHLADRMKENALGVVIRSTDGDESALALFLWECADKIKQRALVEKENHTREQDRGSGRGCIQSQCEWR